MVTGGPHRSLCCWRWRKYGGLEPARLACSSVGDGTAGRLCRADFDAIMKAISGDCLVIAAMVVETGLHGERGRVIGAKVLVVSNNLHLPAGMVTLAASDTKRRSAEAPLSVNRMIPSRLGRCQGEDVWLKLGYHLGIVARAKHLIYLDAAMLSRPAGILSMIADREINLYSRPSQVSSHRSIGSLSILSADVDLPGPEGFITGASKECCQSYEAACAAH